MIRVFGLILTEYLDRFQPSIWTGFDRVFGLILTEYLDRFRPSIWILNFSFPAAVTNTLSPARQYFLIFRREAMSTVFGTIHFLEIILLLPVPETSRSFHFLEIILLLPVPETSRSFWINACQAGERIIFSPVQSLSLLRVTVLCGKFLSDCVGNLPYFIGQI